MVSDADLHLGIILKDASGRPILYRYLTAADDVDVITDLLHEAYAPLAAAGMRFVASHQDAGVTRQRLGQGRALVAYDDSEVIGTITLADTSAPGGSPFYNRADVASFGQFAVRPTRQRRGVGSTMMDLVEGLAKDRGANWLALDTSERATRLIGFYETRGYAFIEHHRWDTVNYRSVIMAKRLS